MIDIKLPFWLEGSELLKLVQGVVTWWDLAQEWLSFLLNQFDPLTCSLPILNLIAYQRDIERFKNEPLVLYRKRVKFALINCQDSGSKIGFSAIFERLGLGVVETVERFYPIDWDVIIVKLTNSQLIGSQPLIDFIIRKYGRTCRRYQIQTDTPVGLYIAVAEYSTEFHYCVASTSVNDIPTVWDNGETIWDSNETIWDN